MNELQNSTFVPAYLSADDYENTVRAYERAIQEIKRLDEALSSAEAGRNAMHRAYEQKSNIITEVTSIIQREYDNGELEEGTVMFDELCEWLEIETQVETEVTVTATWNITVRHPKGYDVENDLATHVNLAVDGDDCDIDNDPYPEVEVSAN